MKKHAIIPIFIPHLGCPNACVFCNQVRITARHGAPSSSDVRGICETWLSTLTDPRPDVIELAFYGGSFTAIPLDMQRMYLSVAKEYKDSGRIDKIHMSTRPDCISREILDLAVSYGVDTIELGVQSFDEEVLTLSRRGHDVRAVYEACDLIKEYGLELGIQLMVGLPGDTLEKDVYSASEAARIGPSLARLYPTLVLEDTELYDLCSSGEYVPMTREEAVTRTAAMYRILRDAGITIMRVGLKSTDLINNEALGEMNAGAYHPAFRQLVESRIAREDICEMLDESGGTKIRIFSHPSWFSDMIGQGGENRKYLEERYPNLNMSFGVDETLTPGKFRVSALQEV